MTEYQFKKREAEFEKEHEAYFKETSDADYLEEARNSRYSAEDEKPGHHNTFNLLVFDYLNDIEQKIRQVMHYTDATVYSLKDLCNRTDIVDEIVRLLKEEGFKVSLEPHCELELDIFWDDLFITWKK